MSISAAQMTALQALLMRDSELFDQLGTDDEVSRIRGFAALTAAAFVVAARRRFPPGSSPADVVRFVGQIRARDQGLHADLSAGAAEEMLLGTLRGVDGYAGKSDQITRGYAQIALLAELTSDLDGRQLDDLLAEARDLADQWLERDR